MKTTVNLTILGIIICLVNVTSVKADEPCPTPNTSTSSLKITKMPAGAMPGFFSVAADRKVVFSQGNLQWQGSTNTWRFADEQYEVIGTAAGSANMVFDTTLRKTSEDWIDLFPWASSGYGKIKPYMVHYEPWSDFYINGNVYNSMTGEYANYDWGVYNPISNGGNAAGLWRTLTREEWNYLFNNRARHDSLWSYGSIRNKDNTIYIYGMFLFPDNFIFPEDFTMKFPKKEAVQYNAATNRLTYTQWEQYEALGTIFLPAANYAYANSYNTAIITTTYYYTYYWTASYGGSSNYNASIISAAPCCISSTNSSANTTSAMGGYHYPIRLAKTLEQPVIE